MRKFNLINTANLVHNFCLYIYQSLHVLGDYVPIIRRSNFICATLGTCYSVWLTFWYAPWAGRIQDSHPQRIASTKCHINTVVSHDDGHLVARNM